MNVMRAKKAKARWKEALCVRSTTQPCTHGGEVTRLSAANVYHTFVCVFLSLAFSIARAVYVNVALNPKLKHLMPAPAFCWWCL